MKELEVFRFNEMVTRVINLNDEPWWVVKDVCDILGISDVSDAVERLDNDEKGRGFIPTPGGKQAMLIINESGLYSLIIRSNKPEAKKFQKWITSEVLPSIRKHGAYMTPATIDSIIADPDSAIKLLQTLKAEREAKLALAAQVEVVSKERDALEIELDKSKEWMTIKKVADINGLSWKDLSWQLMIKKSKAMGVPYPKVFDANFPNGVNSYHISVWKAAYPYLDYGEQ